MNSSRVCWSTASETSCETASANRTSFLQLKDAEGFPAGSVGKESACQAADCPQFRLPRVQIPGSGSFPGEGKGNSLQYSCLENSMEWGAWWLQSMGSQSRTRLSTHIHRDNGTRKCFPDLCAWSSFCQLLHCVIPPGLPCIYKCPHKKIYPKTALHSTNNAMLHPGSYLFNLLCYATFNKFKFFYKIGVCIE